MSERTNNVKYIAGAGVDNVVFAGPAILERIIVGKGVAGGIVEVSDHASVGNGNVKVYLEDPSVGEYVVGAKFDKGITANLTTQTNVSIVWRKA